MSRRPRDTHDTRDAGASSGTLGHAPLRPREARRPIPPRDDPGNDRVLVEFSQDDLVAALRAVEGLTDIGNERPNFHFRSRPFLHFHENPEGTFADVRFGSGDFEPVWASTPAERQALLVRVCEHVETINRDRKAGQPGPRRNRGRRR